MLFKKLDKHLTAIGIIVALFTLGGKIVGMLFYIEWKYLDFTSVLVGFYLCGVYGGVYIGILLKTNDLFFRGVFQALIQALFVFWFLSYGKEKIDSVIDLQNDFSTLAFVVLYIAFPMMMVSGILYEVLRHSPAGKYLIKRENVPEKTQNAKKKK